MLAAFRGMEQTTSSFFLAPDESRIISPLIILSSLSFYLPYPAAWATENWASLNYADCKWQMAIK